MKTALYAAILTMAIVACQSSDTAVVKTINVEYPTSRKDTIIDDYHGEIVADPYRWLEDDHSAETEAWVVEQNDVTNTYLSEVPYRETIKRRLEKIMNYERYGTPFIVAGQYYFFKNDGLQNQSVLYRQKTKEDIAEVVLDPNTFSADGTVSLGAISFNKEGNLLAYQISEGGSDWRKIKVLDIVTGQMLEDSIAWVKFSGISWQGNGFYYSRYPTPTADNELSETNSYHKVYYHAIGTTQDADVLVYEEPKHPKRNSYAQTTDDEEYLVISNSESTSGNALLVQQRGENIQKRLVETFDHDFNLVDNVGSKLYFLTNKDAPLQRIIAIDFNRPTMNNWEEIIPEGQQKLQSAKFVNDKLLVTYLVDAKSQIKAYSLDGTFIETIKLPGIGTVGSISGEKDQQEAFYSFTSFTYPSTIFQLNTDNLSSSVFKESQIDFDSDAYESSQVFYESYDGTKVPMFITHKKGITLDGNNPTLLYGYGGFDISIRPSFSASNLILLENGGIYAVANIRGGGEYGKEWHQAGTKERKQNVFDDFQAAAEFLIAKNYTRSEKLGIMGGSNGGLLVGACMTQRPDLFKVAIPRVGVLDMLRYHEFTIGWAWAEDYGRSDDSEAFKYLKAYSPLHNIKEVEYPATFVMTADHDDRVVPAHSFKFAATLQENQRGDNPVLIRIESSAGHGAGKPISKIIEETADMWSFAFYNWGEDISGTAQ